jgi:hypothetical protein
MQNSPDAMSFYRLPVADGERLDDTGVRLGRPKTLPTHPCTRARKRLQGGGRRRSTRADVQPTEAVKEMGVPDEVSNGCAGVWGRRIMVEST